jgi:hypothetical protein
MLSYQTAVKLKEAGYPFKTFRKIYAIQEPTETTTGEIWCRSTPELLDPEKEYLVPTLEELIEACGDDFSSLHSVGAGFSAEVNADCEKEECEEECPGHHSYKGIGTTPSEAVSNCWLALNT